MNIVQAEAVKPVKGALIPALPSVGGGSRSPGSTAALLRAIRSGALVAGSVAAASAASTRLTSTHHEAEETGKHVMDNTGM